MPNLKRVLTRLFGGSQGQSSTYSVPMDARIKSLLDCIATTQEQEDDCAQFDARMDCLAELLAQGKARGEVLPPEFEAHLLHSLDCREEFDALIAILKAEEAGEIEQL